MSYCTPYRCSPAVALVLTLVAVVVAGCGRDNPLSPTIGLQGPRASSSVALDGIVAISESGRLPVANDTVYYVGRDSVLFTPTDLASPFLWDVTHSFIVALSRRDSIASLLAATASLDPVPLEPYEDPYPEGELVSPTVAARVDSIIRLDSASYAHLADTTQPVSSAIVIASTMSFDEGEYEGGQKTCSQRRQDLRTQTRRVVELGQALYDSMRANRARPIPMQTVMLYSRYLSESARLDDMWEEYEHTCG